MAPLGNGYYFFRSQQGSVSPFCIFSDQFGHEIIQKLNVKYSNEQSHFKRSDPYFRGGTWSAPVHI